MNIGWLIFLLIILTLLILAIINDFKNPIEIEKIQKGISVILNDIVIDKLLLNPNFCDKDVITKYYVKQIQQSYHIKNIESYNDNIAILNVNSFEPINLNYTKKQCMEAPIRMMHRFNISILGILEFPIQDIDKFIEIINNFNAFPIYHSVDDFELAFRNSKEKTVNIVLSKYPIVKQQKVILPSEPEWIFKHKYAIFFKVPEHPIFGTKLFCLTHLEEGQSLLNNTNKEIENANIRGRKNQIHAIFTTKNKKPDIIMGTLNFQPNTSEYALMASKYHINSVGVDYTIPDYANLGYNSGLNIVDYIWYKKNDKSANWSIKTYAVNYPWSNHRPVIGVYVNI